MRVRFDSKCVGVQAAIYSGLLLSTLALGEGRKAHAPPAQDVVNKRIDAPAARGAAKAVNHQVGPLRGLPTLFGRPGATALPAQGSAFEIEGLFPGERLGGAVAMTNEHLLIGVYRADRPIGVNDLSSGLGAGAVEARERGGNAWQLDIALSPGSAGRIVIDEVFVADDALGRSLDLQDDIGVAGMPGDDEAAGWAGAAAVLTRSGSGWRVSDKLVPDPAVLGVDSVAGWQVGRDVAIDGEWIALGAPRASFTDADGNNWAEAGAVLLYRESGNGWAYQGMLWSSTPGHFEHFGLSVAMDTGTLVVGIPNADDGADMDGNQGAIEIFASSGGIWSRVNRFGTPVFAMAGAKFGWCVAIHGSTIAVGEPGFAVERGRAWVLEQAFSGDTDWSAATSLDLLVPTIPGIPGGARMGASIDISDCTVAVGGPGNGVVSSFTGQAWIFSRASNSENAWGYLSVPMIGLNAGDGFGDAIALNATTVAVGAWLGGDADAGTVTLEGITCDCDGNGVPDLEQIANDLSLDCNLDGMIDWCQIMFDPSLDCDANDILDSCQFEPPGAFEWPESAEGNGSWYRVDLSPTAVTQDEARLAASAVTGRLASLSTPLEAAWVSTRAQYDPDKLGPLWLGGLQLMGALQPDGDWTWDDDMPWSHTAWAVGEPDDLDGIEDDQQNALVADGVTTGLWTWADEDELAVHEAWLVEFSPNCDGDTELDACQIAQDPSLDCDADGILDTCEIESGSGPDCDNNGQLDSCDIDAGLSDDCDLDGIPDACALGDGTAQDCNANGLPDLCDIAQGTSDDDDGDGIPDECQLLTINEVLSEPTDLNGDGFADALDTFVEISNRTTDEFDVSGWQVRVDGLIWHVFATDSLIAERCCAIVTGGGSPSETVFGTGLLSAANYGFLVQLPDADDGNSHTVSIFDSTGTMVDAFTWDSTLSDPGISATRCPDVFGDILDHWTCSGIGTSPGRDNQNDLFDGCPAPDNDPDLDGVLDPFDNCPFHYNPAQTDCDDDGVGDVCAIAQGLVTDCNGNGVPDSCDVADGTSEDCDGNGLADICEIAANPDLDCNNSGWLDSCEIAWGWESDCNKNAIVDWCELDDIGADCDFDGILDACEDPDDVTGGPDLNGDCLVDLADLLIVLNDLGCEEPAFCIGDIDGDGDTDTDDLVFIVNLINGG